MTTHDHNKVLGVLHLVYGGFNALSALLVAVVFLAVGLPTMASASPDDAAEIGLIFGLLGVVAVLMFLAFGLAPLVAGYGLLKKRPWAKTAGVVSSAISAFGFPLGTALCVYTLWFLFGEGKALHGPPQFGGVGQYGSLNEARPLGWDARHSAHAPRREYVPPPQPPDWRGDS